ncbi:MAG: hemerythrin [Desulfobacteraceae bacterium]|nr:MAG: hemerythrin [Desulfobacteraceae bacterium]
MPLMEWDNTFSVNVGEIDDQHRRLVGMLNRLNDAMKARQAKEVLGPIIDGLVDYAATHFATEETYFDRFGFSGALRHKTEHRRFVDRIREFQKGFSAGKMMLSIEIMEFLKTWLVDHIKGSDQRYSGCFNENGLR